eukprot:2859859-Amphidinium_carterae.1
MQECARDILWPWSPSVLVMLITLSLARLGRQSSGGLFFVTFKPRGLWVPVVVVILLGIAL